MGPNNQPIEQSKPKISHFKMWLIGIGALIFFGGFNSVTGNTQVNDANIQAPKTEIVSPTVSQNPVSENILFEEPKVSASPISTPALTPLPTPTPKPSIKPSPSAAAIQNNTTSEVKYYTNTDGNRIQSPTYYDSAPAGASAECNDGTYSFSQNRRGTCSGHGGVAQWL